MADIPFRLDIVETGDQWVVTCTCPRGKTVNRIPAPFTPDVLRRTLADVEKALIRSCSPVVTRRAAPVEQSVRAFGETLSDAVLTGDARRLFDRCREDARERQASLRILLDTDGPNVSVIPWEFTVNPHVPDDYLALRVPIVRSPHLIGSVPSSRVELPLRVLGVSARPADLPSLDTGRERDDIEKAFRNCLTPGDVHIEWLHGDRWTDLADAIRSHPWHVLHIMSHGGFDAETGSGYLQLSADDGTARPISAIDLARFVSDNPSLRLIVLNACESATPGMEGVFTSTAAKLVREGVPAVVAMQYEITDDAALVFASSFYGRIARGLPVDRAMTLAREAVKMTNGSLEWATPVLFLSSEETQIFEVPERVRAGSRTDPHPPPQAPPRQPPPGPPPGKPPPRQPPPQQPTAHRRSAELAPPPLLRKIRALPAAGACSHMAVGPRGLLAVAGIDGTVRVISASTGRVVSECVLARRTRPVRLAWSPWPRHLASLHEDGAIVVWDAETQAPVRTMRVPVQQADLLRTVARRIDAMRSATGHVDAIAFTGDGKWLAASGGEHVHFFDANGNRARELRLEPDRPAGARWPPPRPGNSRVIFGPGDRSIVVAAGDGAVWRLDVRGRVMATFRHPNRVLAMAAAGDRLATGSTDGSVHTWSWDGRLLHRTQHGSPVGHLAFCAGESLLVTAADDGSVSLWDRDEALAGTATLNGRPAGVGCAGDDVFTATQGGVLELWSPPARHGREGRD